MALIHTHHADSPSPFTPHFVRFPGKASQLLMSPSGLFTLEIGGALLEGGGKHQFSHLRSPTTLLGGGARIRSAT